MGWSYPDWRGPFYARETPENRLLAQYAGVFDAIELDTTFFGAPRPQTLALWDRQTPQGFFFSAKAPRAITHERRLLGPAAIKEAQDFGKLLQDGFAAKLGHLLLQLPPDFGPGEARHLLSFADALAPDSLPWTVELRDSAWQTTPIAEQLAERGIGVATTDRVSLPGARLTYVRLLGEENSVARFDQRVIDRESELDQWAERLRAAEGRVFLHVRNFYEGHAPGTLTALRQRLGLSTPMPPGQQQMSLF